MLCNAILPSFATNSIWCGTVWNIAKFLCGEESILDVIHDVEASVVIRLLFLDPVATFLNNLGFFELAAFFLDIREHTAHHWCIRYLHFSRLPGKTDSAIFGLGFHLLNAVPNEVRFGFLGGRKTLHLALTRLRTFLTNLYAQCKFTHSQSNYDDCSYACA